MSDHPLFLFAPGAGAPSSSRWMLAWRERLAAAGDVVAFDYPYMRAGRKSPDRLPALIAAHRAALDDAVAAFPGRRAVFLIGKSMGGRVGCHLAAEEGVGASAAGAGPTVSPAPVRAVAGVICLGYPLQSGSTGALRDQVLLALRTPILFVQGTRDPLCPLDKLAAVRARMTAANRLHVVEGGDHSLEVSAQQRKAAGETQADSDARVLPVIRDFVAGGAAGVGVGPVAPTD
jgi:predicted alpha/beta-hydrolase family hydrolase